MSKKKFFNLLKKAAQPVPKEGEKLPDHGDYTEKRTHPNKTVGALKKRNDESRAKSV